MKHKSHVVFVVPDGVGVKNYLYSNVLKHVGFQSRVTIWSTLPQSAFEGIKALHQIDFEYRELQLYPENIKTRLLREAATYARLNYNQRVTGNPTILMNWRVPKRNFKLRLLYKLAELIGKSTVYKTRRILKLEARAKASWSEALINTYKADLEEMQATSLFITHQRVAGLMPICMAAAAKKIKTTTAIFSWDNLPKARLNVSVDQYIVWSDWMKDEMQIYYQEINPSQVFVTGTPQFEFYKEEQRLIDRVSFAKKYGLNPKAKWICFSGDDELSSPYDPYYLKDIAENLPQDQGPIQIIFRRCPVDFSNRYDEVLKQYNDIIISIDPIWYTEAESWIGYYSKIEDINLQVNLAHHCSMVINLGSTMALDFATFNKPCLYVNYDPVVDAHWTTKDIYKFQHLTSMEGLEPVGWINSVSEIDSKISQAFHDELGRDRALWFKKIVQHPHERSSEIIAKKIV